MARNLRADGGRGGNMAGTIDGGAVSRYVERVARVMREQKLLRVELKEICAEADEAGVATRKQIRQLGRESLLDQEVLIAGLDAMAALRQALGQYSETALGAAALGQPAPVPGPVRRGRGRPRLADRLPVEDPPPEAA